LAGGSPPLVHTGLALKELTEHSVQVFWAVSHIFTVALATFENSTAGQHPRSAGAIKKT